MPCARDRPPAGRRSRMVDSRRRARHRLEPAPVAGVGARVHGRPHARRAGTTDEDDRRTARLHDRAAVPAGAAPPGRRPAARRPPPARPSRSTSGPRAHREVGPHAAAGAATGPRPPGGFVPLPLQEKVQPRPVPGAAEVPATAAPDRADPRRRARAPRCRARWSATRAARRPATRRSTDAYDGLGATWQLYWQAYRRDSLDGLGLAARRVGALRRRLRQRLLERRADGVRRRRRPLLQPLHRQRRRHRPRAHPRRHRSSPPG